MKRLPVVLLSLFLIALPAAARDWIVEESLGNEGLSWERDGSDWKLSVPAGISGEATGSPDLPGLLLSLPLPRGERLADWSWESGPRQSLGRRLPAARPPLTDESGRIYEDPGLPPGELIFLGQPAGRGLRQARFFWRPFRVEDGELSLSENVRVRLVSEPDPDPPLAVERDDREANGGAFAPRPRPSLEGSPVDAVILTVDELAPAFQELADWHTRLGTRTVVVTKEWVLEHYAPGADDAETLRFFLQDAYRLWGLQVLIIGGDVSEIPVRYARSRAGALDRVVPNDLYYSCLDGSWNADGDAWWGELPYSYPGHPDYDPGDDEADILPELWVGRISVSAPEDAEAMVQKIIDYRESPPGDWQGSILFLAEVLFPKDWEPGDIITRDGAQYAVGIIDDFLSEEMDYACLFQNWMAEEWADYSPGPLTVAEALAAMGSGSYCIVDHNGHGAPHDMSVGDDNITVNHLGQLANEKPFLITLMNCSSTAFDQNCLAEAYCMLPETGAVAAFGTTRESYPQYTERYYDAFYRHLWQDGITRPGEIFFRMRNEYAGFATGQSYARWTYLIVTLLGDPLVDLWSGDAREYSVTAPDQLLPGDKVLNLEVTDGRAPADSVQVTLFKEGEVWSMGFTDGAGQLSLNVQPVTPGPLYLSVRGPNGVIYRREIAVEEATGDFAYLESWSLDDGTGLDPANDGDGLAEAGELLGLDLTVRNGGTGELSNLTLTLLQAHDSLDVVSGLQTLAALPPGGSVLAEDLRVRAAVGCEDGQLLPVILELTADGLSAMSDTLLFPVAAPDLSVSAWVLDDSPAAGGDGDGIIEPGEPFHARCRLLNQGQGQTGALSLHLEALAAGIEIADADASAASLEEMEEASPDPGFLLSLDDPSLENQTRLVISMEQGGQLADTLDFLPPAAPEGLEAGFSEDPNAIDLLWTPVEDADLAGYHVYLAQGEGAFERLTTRPLEHSTFLATGLPGLTTVRAYVTALDDGGMESAPGEVLLTATSPPQIAGFPTSLGQGSTSAPAVGNISPRGGLEVVAASDYVYAWSWDGTEIRDGDLDADTDGVFSLAAADIVGAVTILPLFDDEGCDQIVVASRGDNPQGFRGIHVLDRHGDEMPGWPQATSHWVWASVAGGDLDGDGDLELVALDLNGRLYAFHHDGSELADGDGDPGTNGVLRTGLGSWPMGCPALGDMDGDGDDDIVLTGGGGHAYLHIIDETGVDLPGLPVSPHGLFQARGPIALAWMGGDRSGPPEAIIHSENDYLYVFTASGTHYAGFPLPFVQDNPYAVGPGVVPVDVNADQVPELILAQNSNEGLHRIDFVDAGGNSLAGWPIALESGSQASPVVGDLDGDGALEIVFAGDEGVIRGWNLDGSVQEGFPIPTGDFVRSTPLLADLDQDGDVELIACSQDKKLYVWDFEGAFSEAAFPWPTQSGNYRRTGLIGDWDQVPVILAGLQLDVLDGAVRLRWLDENDLVQSWSLSRERELCAGWAAPEWVFRHQSFAGGEVDWTDEGLEPGARYRYTAHATLAGMGEESILLGEVSLPAAAWADRLRGAWPNPFNPSTTLSFELAEEGRARLEIFSVEGRRLRVLVDETLAAGRHERLWDGRDERGRAVGSGVYLVRFQRPGLAQSQRIVLLK